MQKENNKKICQSCAMPMEKDSDFGTGKDGERSREYCAHCFQGGEFTRPDMKLNDQVERLASMAVSRFGTEEKEAHLQAVRTLSQLKRWQKGNALQAKIVIFFALLGMFVFSLIVFFFNTSNVNSSETTDSANFPWVVFVPIFTAVFIPLFSNQKNQTEIPEKKQKIFALFLLGIVLLVVFMTLFLFL